MTGAAQRLAVGATDTGIVLNPDHGRLITRFFVPGREDVGPGDSRAAPVIERILGLDDDDVEVSLRQLDDHLGDRHASLGTVFDAHADMIVHRLDPTVALSPSRRRLLGASFTHEYAIEGASICNPSIVAHPDQSPDGGTAFVLSVRGIGEGHRSSIGFRTGTVAADGTVEIDQPGPFPVTATNRPGVHQHSVFQQRLADSGDDLENAAFVLDSLPATFTDAELAERIDGLRATRSTRRHTMSTIDQLEYLQRCSYRADFATSADLSERVLWPQSPAESHGMEDARFVHFTDDDGTSTYLATYTAYDGVNVAQHLLSTDDFVSFSSTPMAGAAAIGKGLALFPRKVGGRYATLSRSDRESNSIGFSDDLYCWDRADTIQTPVRTWEILQLGNCGSPIETSAGWLVLTHGVGPMRTYSIGAILLDLNEPQRVIAHGPDPLLTPGRNQRDGYVPNVVYSCGGLALGDLLVLPYGVGDQTIAIATFSIDEIIGSMQPVDPAH